MWILTSRASLSVFCSGMPGLHNWLCPWLLFGSAKTGSWREEGTGLVPSCSPAVPAPCCPSVGHSFHSAHLFTRPPVLGSLSHSSAEPLRFYEPLSYWRWRGHLYLRALSLGAPPRAPGVSAAPPPLRTNSQVRRVPPGGFWFWVLRAPCFGLCSSRSR